MLIDHYTNPTAAPRRPVEVLALIPARGGSKGIPRKNLAPLGGAPLIAWSIDAARRSEYVTRIVVSTEDEEIAAVAREHGAETPFLRPTELASDAVDTRGAYDYTLERLRADEGYDPEVVLQLYPTSPFRGPGFLDRMMRELLEGYVELKTVRRARVHAGGLQRCDASGLLRPAAAGYPACAFRPSGLLTARSFRYFEPHRLRTYVVEDPVALVDIDLPADLMLAERMIESGMAPRLV